MSPLATSRSYLSQFCKRSETLILKEKPTESSRRQTITRQKGRYSRERERERERERGVGDRELIDRDTRTSRKANWETDRQKCKTIGERG